MQNIADADVDANVKTLTEEAEISKNSISASLDLVASKPSGGIAPGSV